MGDDSYEAGYRDGAANLIADIRHQFDDGAGDLNALLVFFRTLTGDPGLQWPGDRSSANTMSFSGGNGSAEPVTISGGDGTVRAYLGGGGANDTVTISGVGGAVGFGGPNTVRGAGHREGCDEDGRQ